MTYLTNMDSCMSDEKTEDSDLEKAEKSVLKGGERVSKGGQRGRDTDDE